MSEMRIPPKCLACSQGLHTACGGGECSCFCPRDGDGCKTPRLRNGNVVPCGETGNHHHLAAEEPEQQ